MTNSFKYQIGALLLIGASGCATNQPRELNLPAESSANFSSPTGSYVISTTSAGRDPKRTGYCVAGEEHKKSSWPACPDAKTMLQQSIGPTSTAYISVETLEPVYPTAVLCTVPDGSSFGTRASNRGKCERMAFHKKSEGLISGLLDSLSPATSYRANFDANFFAANLKRLGHYKVLERDLKKDLVYRSQFQQRAEAARKKEIEDRLRAQRARAQREQDRLDQIRKEADRKRLEEEHYRTRHATAHLGKNIPNTSIFCPNSTYLERTTGRIDSSNFHSTRMEGETFADWQSRVLESQYWCAYQQYKYNNETFMQFKVRNGLMR
jgi:hypothetical protein